jgi:hypothetical protein
MRDRETGENAFFFLRFGCNKTNSRALGKMFASDFHEWWGRVSEKESRNYFPRFANHRRNSQNSKFVWKLPLGLQVSKFSNLILLLDTKLLSIKLSKLKF